MTAQKVVDDIGMNLYAGKDTSEGGIADVADAGLGGTDQRDMTGEYFWRNLAAKDINCGYVEKCLRRPSVIDEDASPFVGWEGRARQSDVLNSEWVANDHRPFSDRCLDQGERKRGVEIFPAAHDEWRVSHDAIQIKVRIEKARSGRTFVKPGEVGLDGRAFQDGYESFLRKALHANPCGVQEFSS